MKLLLRNFIGLMLLLFNLGYHIKGKPSDVKSKSFAQILEQVKGKDEERVVSTLLLRTLKMARYDA